MVVDLCLGVQFLTKLGHSAVVSKQHSFKACFLVLLGEGGLEMLNWCAGASYYRWCRNMHSLLKTLTAMVAIVIVFMQIVTVVMVRFQLFLQSTFKSQHFPSVKWLQFIFAPAALSPRGHK